MRRAGDRAQYQLEKPQGQGVSEPLFRANQVLVISDGLHARVGSLTAGLDRFTPWRTIERRQTR